MVSDTPPTLSAVLPTRGQVPGEEKRGFPPRAFASQDSLIPLGEGYSACPLFFLWLVLHPQHVRARYPYNTKQSPLTIPLPINSVTGFPGHTVLVQVDTQLCSATNSNHF